MMLVFVTILTNYYHNFLQIHIFSYFSKILNILEQEELPSPATCLDEYGVFEKRVTTVFLVSSPVSCHLQILTKISQWS
jgi:hypothetical protein